MSAKNREKWWRENLKKLFIKNKKRKYTQWWYEVTVGEHTDVNRQDDSY